MDLGLSDFFDLTPDLVWIMGKNGFLKRVNKSVVNKLGYTETELYTNPITQFLHPDDIESTLNNRKRLFAGEVLHNFANRYISRSGEIIWLEWTSVYITEKEVVFAIAKDITARKKIEAEVEESYAKFKGLASHFKNRIETDREFFAYELHEELAQLVSVINMDLGWLKQQQHALPLHVLNRVEHGVEVSKLLIKTIQRLAFSFSPKMMHELGLTATMEWFCKEFTVLNGIACEFESSFEESALSMEMKTDIFRICQDALTGGLNCEQAGSIKIFVQRTVDAIELGIMDSGTGLLPQSEKQAIAIKDIEERAFSINGRVSVIDNLAAGSGFIIKLQNPVPTQTELAN